jgi:hypothetical protein
MSRLISITKDGETGQCMPSALPTWERNGWTRADDGSSEEPQEETEAPAKKTTTRKAD